MTRYLYPQKVFDFLGTPSAAKSQVTSRRLETIAEAVQMYIVKTMWSNNYLHLYKGSFLTKKLSHMPVDGLFLIAVGSNER
jgi:hypothetical protein